MENKPSKIEIEDRGVPFIVIYANSCPQLHGMTELQAIGVLESGLEYFRMWRNRQFEKFLGQTEEKK